MARSPERVMPGLDRSQDGTGFEEPPSIADSVSPYYRHRIRKSYRTTTRQPRFGYNPLVHGFLALVGVTVLILGIGLLPQGEFLEGFAMIGGALLVFVGIGHDILLWRRKWKSVEVQALDEERSQVS